MITKCVQLFCDYSGCGIYFVYNLYFEFVVVRASLSASVSGLLSWLSLCHGLSWLNVTVSWLVTTECRHVMACCHDQLSVSWLVITQCYCVMACCHDKVSQCHGLLSWLSVTVSWLVVMTKCHCVMACHHGVPLCHGLLSWLSVTVS